MRKLVLGLAFAAAVALGVANSSFVAANGTKYHISNIKLTFSQAFARCKRYGWALATEHTPEATKAINDAIASAGHSTYAHYLGGFQESDFYPPWIWLNDGKDFDYTNWYGGNAATTYECLVKLEITTHAGQWTAENGATPGYFICESGESDNH